MLTTAILLIAETSFEASGLLRNAAIDKQRARSLTTEMFVSKEANSDFSSILLYSGDVLCVSFSL